MGLKSFNPYTASRRYITVVDKSHITKQEPEKALLEPKKRSGGRNNHGEIVIWHRGGGHKKQYRKVDFRRDKLGVPAKVAAIEYDPNRSANLALLHYADGDKRYILHPVGLEVGATVSTGEGSDILPGNALKNVRALAGRNRRAHFQSHGMQDVALVAIRVVQQRQIRAAVRVVLDGRYFRGHSELVAPEVHLPVLLLVSAAAVPDHDFAVIVAAARALLRFQQRLFRLLLGDVALVHDGDEPPRRRIWIKALQSHRCLLPSYCESLKPPRSYRFSAYSIIFSPSASLTYAFF